MFHAKHFFRMFSPKKQCTFSLYLRFARVLGSKMVYRLHSKQLLSSSEWPIGSIQSDLLSTQAVCRLQKVVCRLFNKLRTTSKRLADSKTNLWMLKAACKLTGAACRLLKAACRLLSKPRSCFTVTLLTFKRVAGYSK